MAARKNATATQVSAVTNSYMSPQGSRCTDSPLVTTPVVWAASPTQVRATAIATTRPTRPVVTTEPPPAAPPAGGVPAGVSPAGAPTRAGTRAAAAAAFAGFFPNAKSQS